MAGNNTDFENIIKNGAIIIDVRENWEYEGGHIKNSVNIPLNTLKKEMSWLIKKIPIITCCASGSRSAEAKRILESNGFEKVYNGGSCDDLGKIKAGGSCPIK